MGQWKYRKPEPADIQGVCVVCNLKSQFKRPNGCYAPYCNNCKKKLYGAGKSKWKPKFFQRQKKDICEACGFIPKHRCQLDVDHIDGDHSNNDIKNLQTLCANCHRLKTYIQIWNPELA